MQLTKKDIQKARRLARCFSTGLIPINEVRDFLERVANSSDAQPRPRKGNKLTDIKNHYKSIL